MPIYTVLIKAPEIYEETVVNADSEQQAKDRAIASALARQAEVTKVLVREQTSETGGV